MSAIYGINKSRYRAAKAGNKVEFRMERDDFVVAFYRNLRVEWNRAVDEKRRKKATKTSDKKQTIKTNDKIAIELIV